MKMLGHSRQRDGLRPVSTVHRDGLDTVSRPSLFLGNDDFRVSWHARYLGYVGAVNGAHPDEMTYRPLSTAKYPGDNEGGDWLFFWEVDLLGEIPKSERLHVREFVPYGKKKKPYGNSFAPRGPMLMNRP